MRVQFVSKVGWDKCFSSWQRGFCGYFSYRYDDCIIGLFLHIDPIIFLFFVNLILYILFTIAKNEFFLKNILFLLQSNYICNIII